MWLPKDATSSLGAVISCASPESAPSFLLQYVLENIPVTGTPLLDSVDLHEPEVEEMRVALQSAIEKALIPLRAYAKEYEKFLELHNNDVQYFLK